MAINPAQVAAGAVIGGVASDLYDKSKDKAAEVAGTDHPEHGPIELEMLVTMVADIRRDVQESLARQCKPKFETVWLTYSTTGLTPLRLHREDYDHVSLFTVQAFTVDCVTNVGVGKFAMSVGWNPLDMPDDTDIMVDGAPPGSENGLRVILYKGNKSLDIEGV